MAKNLKVEKITSAAKTLRVLGHPVRIKIVDFLNDGEKNVSTIQKHVRLPQAVTSQHLKLLLVNGLVDKRREKNFIYYRQNETMLNGITNFIQETKG